MRLMAALEGGAARRLVLGLERGVVGQPAVQRLSPMPQRAAASTIVGADRSARIACSRTAAGLAPWPARVFRSSAVICGHLDEVGRFGGFTCDPGAVAFGGSVSQCPPASLHNALWTPPHSHPSFRTFRTLVARSAAFPAASLHTHRTLEGRVVPRRKGPCSADVSETYPNVIPPTTILSTLSRRSADRKLFAPIRPSHTPL